MAPPAAGKKKERVTTPENIRSREMYNHIVLWFKTVDGYIRRKAGKNWTSNAKKHTLACGSNFMHPMTPDDYDRDAKTGKPTKQKLKDIPVIAKKFEKNYIFWLDAPFNTHWFGPKEIYPNPEDWPKDSNGDKHYCAAPDSTSLTIQSKGPPEFKAIIMCPQVLGTSKDMGLAKPITSQQPKDKLLDDMAVQSLHLYKQMFKLFYGQVFVEEMEEEPRDRQVYIAARIPGWPGLQASWKLAGTGQKLVYASTGTDALWLTIHDRAEKNPNAPEPEYYELDAINNPANFAWFALVSLMSSKTGQDWSVGRARPANTPWMLVYTKGKNSPGPLFNEDRLKAMSVSRLKQTTGLEPDPSDPESAKAKRPERVNAAPAVGSDNGSGSNSDDGDESQPGPSDRSNISPSKPGTANPDSKGKQPKLPNPPQKEAKENPPPPAAADPKVPNPNPKPNPIALAKPQSRLCSSSLQKQEAQELRSRRAVRRVRSISSMVLWRIWRMSKISKGGQVDRSRSRIYFFMDGWMDGWMD